MSVPDEFEELEQQWAAELGPVEPPPGFADAVMLRVASRNSPGVARKPHRLLAWNRPWAGLALAAALLLVVFPGVYKLHEDRERRQAAEIEARYDLAMRLTTRTLAHVDRKIYGALQRAGAIPQ
jgi:hypothetical protein